MYRYLALLTVVVTGILLLVGSANSAEPSHAIYLPIIQQPKTPSYFGIAQDIARLPENELLPVINAMDKAKVATVRMPFHWTMIEPQKGEFDFSHYDNIVNRLIANDVEIVGIFVTVPSWANGKTVDNVPDGHDPHYYPPTNSADFAYMTQLVAQKYRGRVDSWVVFNEPNFGRFWQPSPDVDQYVNLLCDAYSSIKVGNPSAQVIGGALAGNGLVFGRANTQADLVNYLPLMYAADADDCYDILAIHLYIHPTSQSIEDVQSRINDTRALMAQEGDTSPLWLNEIGWSSAPDTWGLPTVSDAEMADWITKVYSDLQGVGRIYWYNFRDVGTNPLEPEHNFGLLRFDYSRKPAYDAFIDLRIVD